MTCPCRFKKERERMVKRVGEGVAEGMLVSSKGWLCTIAFSPNSTPELPGRRQTG